MTLFVLGIGLLILGYFTYGRYVEHVLQPDGRQTPAVGRYDGVDFMVLPHWKNMLIQLLNIAGIGPVIGVILGIKFGSIVFLIIPIGNIIGGAVHDILSGMISVREGGINLPVIVKKNLGLVFSVFFTIFMFVLLLLVVVVFVNVPANLIDGMIPSEKLLWYIVGAIFIYYMLATLFPINQIIGRFYPIFGMMLLLGTGALFFVLMYKGCLDWNGFLAETEGFKNGMYRSPENPIIPCLFVTIACGILSGFHATQSPMVARTMSTERNIRPTFYGMMIVEGIIAMIWAAGGMAIYNLMPEQMAQTPQSVLSVITKTFLGSGLGEVTVIAVVILAITSGDTALRSARLCLAELFHFDQKPVFNRLILGFLLAIPIIAILIWSSQSPATFKILWNYFAWGNQVLAAATFCAATVWLLSHRKNSLIAIVPGLFILFVVTTFILWTNGMNGNPKGFGIGLETSYIIAAIFSAVVFAIVIVRGIVMRKKVELEKEKITVDEADSGANTENKAV